MTDNTRILADYLRETDGLTTAKGGAMTDVVARLRQLEAAATPGPWQQEGREVAVGDWAYGSVFIHDRDQEANAALTVAARNALPRLLDIAEAARVLDGYQTKAADRNRLLHPQQREAVLALRAALAALDSQETE